MQRKQCTDCHKISYSMSKKGMWICPHCLCDITNAPILYMAPCATRVLPITTPQAPEHIFLN